MLISEMTFFFPFNVKFIWCNPSNIKMYTMYFSDFLVFRVSFHAGTTFTHTHTGHRQNRDLIFLIFAADLGS